jgi:hypothetical protein
MIAWQEPGCPVVNIRPTRSEPKCPQFYLCVRAQCNPLRTWSRWTWVNCAPLRCRQAQSSGPDILMRIRMTPVISSQARLPWPGSLDAPSGNSKRHTRAPVFAVQQSSASRLPAGARGQTDPGPALGPAEQRRPSRLAPGHRFAISICKFPARGLILSCRYSLCNTLKMLSMKAAALGPGDSKQSSSPADRRSFSAATLPLAIATNLFTSIACQDTEGPTPSGQFFH